MTTPVGDRPASYREVLGVREFRALYAGGVVSGVGDQIAKIALAILVLRRYDSPLLAALAYAVGYLPWVIGGPVLSPLADRLPRRQVMLRCDVARAVLVGAMALPDVPLSALFAMLLTASVLTPPFEAARAATVADVLHGDRYVVGSSLSNITAQAVQMLGFLLGGGVVALLSPRGALLFDAITFLGSWLLISTGVRHRPPAAAGARPTLVTDVVDGARIVFGTPRLRAIVLLAWAGAAFAIVPEGLAVTYAERLGGGALAAGLLTAAAPFGTVVGAIVVGRLVAPSRRMRLVVPLAVVTFLPLVATAVGPSLWPTAALWTLSGVGLAYQLPANAAFVAALPPEARGRAFGLAQSGLQVLQGGSLAVAGWLALSLSPATVVALSGGVGLLSVTALTLAWPISGTEARPAADPPAATPAGGAGGMPTEPLSWTAPYLLTPRPRVLVARLRALATADPDGRVEPPD